MLTAKLVTTDEELAQIANLSSTNLVTNISGETKEKEGFVTWVYPLETLKVLHAITPSVIVKDGPSLAGYALTLTNECAAVYPNLQSTIDHAAKLYYNDKPLTDYSIYYMGQICVDINYRGQGIVNMLYDFHRRQFSPVYDMLITEISVRNPRSLKAHQKAGFEVIDTYLDNGDEWNVVLWDWKK